MEKFPNPETPKSHVEEPNSFNFDQLRKNLEQLRISNSKSFDFINNGSSIATQLPKVGNSFPGFGCSPRKDMVEENKRRPSPIFPQRAWTFNDYMNRNRDFAGNNHKSTSNPNGVGLIDRMPIAMDERDPPMEAYTVNKLIDSAEMLMTDKDWHKVFLKLVKSCDQDQLRLITYKMTANQEWFLNASQHRYGSTSIMNLIKVIARTPLIDPIVLVLSNGFSSLMTNQTGSNVICKCLETLSTRQNQLLYEAALKNCLQLAKHENGCKSLQTFIVNSKYPYKDLLLNMVVEHSACLSQDRSGNYVVQHVLGYHDPVFSNMIFKTLKGHYVRLSKQKGGSYVVEKCLKSGAMELVVEDFILENNKSFSQLAKDPYGNYVIQIALEVTVAADSKLYVDLVKKIAACLELGKSGFAQNIVQLIRDQSRSLFR
ncbi:pumilio homolog 18-like [Tripterygium wilfordii]|uniref:pumilio homolog 18-like n=1 Tax=Tripterygium wilfordii TaxID=458696 RepID=UPI0018F84E14|nr:pumilio homolog 18-like [Tripterygium wilfordii]